MSDRPIRVTQDGDKITIEIRALPAAGDELVAVTAEALEPLGLEYRPILALAQAGTLRTVWIGRRRFTRRSWLVQLADVLPAAADAAPGDDLAAAVAAKARRKR